MTIGTSFGGSPSAILYDTSTRSEGGLSTGIGYDPRTRNGAKYQIQAIGGQTIEVEAHSPYNGTRIVTNSGQGLVTNSGEGIDA